MADAAPVSEARRIPPVQEHSPCLSDERGVGDLERSKRPRLWNAERIHDELYEVGRVADGTPKTIVIEHGRKRSIWMKYRRSL